MTCLRDIKYLTVKKALALQPIYYVKMGLKCSGKISNPPSVIKLEDEALKKALDYNLLYDARRCFTTPEEADAYIEGLHKEQTKN